MNSVNITKLQEEITRYLDHGIPLSQSAQRYLADSFRGPRPIVNNPEISSSELIKGLIEEAKRSPLMVSNPPSDLKYLVNRLIQQLKNIPRFNIEFYRVNDFESETERYIEPDGDYIDSYEIDAVIDELEELIK